MFISCANYSRNVLKSKKVNIDDVEMLHGSIDRQQLYYDYPDWKVVEDKYRPSDEFIKKLSNLKASISVEIFLGTWCEDSEREVPAFYKIIDLADIIDNMKINVWAVDRKKTLSNSLAKKRNIEYVPTFIFFESGKEIGRIIEMPESLLEEDILNILKSI